MVEVAPVRQLTSRGIAVTDQMQYATRDLPTGTLTLLFADIEGSTQVLQQLGERYASIQVIYRQLLNAACQQWNGYKVDEQGDALFAVFARATDAVSAAVEAQRSLAAHSWPDESALRVRMGLHTGTPEQTATGYVGLDVHYAARLAHAAHGGQVLLSQTTHALVKNALPEGVGLLDIGEYRLRDFPHHQRLFQLVISDLPAVFPPLRTTANSFQNLPAQLTPLIGREQEITAVCALLQRNEVRLLTLTGTGGIGKTRLGIEVAAQLCETFADGVVYVPLAPIIHPSLVLPAIKQAPALMQPLHNQSTQHLDDLKTLLRDRHMLLVLDNFEQVLDAAPDLTDLLLACPSLKVLVTSRAMLRVQGEYEFIVPPLPLPKCTHLPTVEALTQYASVALFLERALSIKPDLPLTKANIQAIATICVYLDGLPLAIELAAARIKLLPPQALLRQLTQTHRLAVLTGGARDAPERQQTLRSTLDWSYNLLDSTEQQLFRLLSIFVGGASLDAIASVYNAVVGVSIVAPVLDTLASLIDKSLLLQPEQVGEEVRFVMLETVREYGLESLHIAGEDEVAWQALASYYMSLTEQAELRYSGAEQVAWLQRLEQEHENMRVVLQWLLTQGETDHDMTMALRMGTALRKFWVIRGPYREGRVFLERALAERAGVAPAVQAKALFALANLAFLQSDFDAAEASCQESLKLFRELGDRRGIAYALYLLAWVARDDITVDIALTREALVLFRELDNKEFIAWSIYTLAYLSALRGEYERSIRLIEKGLTLHRALGNTRGVAHSLLTKGHIHIHSQGNLKFADACLDESLPLLKELDDREGIATAGILRGQLALRRGNTSLARSLFEESLHLYKKAGSPQGRIHALSHLARAIAAQGDDEIASGYYREGLALARELSMKEWMATCLEGLAVVAVKQYQSDRAVCLWGAAESLREAVHVPIPLNERASYQRMVTDARAVLGEHTFADLWALGRMVTLDQALTLPDREIALPASTTALSAPSATFPAGLTEREVEVLRLVARGLKNVEIAEELGLSKKTIAHHMTHIFNKTTCENRASVVTFAFQHNLI